MTNDDNTADCYEQARSEPFTPRWPTCTICGDGCPPGSTVCPRCKQPAIKVPEDNSRYGRRKLRRTK